MNNISTQKGRPSVKMNWPAGEFTVNDVLKSISYPVSRVTIQLRVNKAVEEGVIVKVREDKSGKGRPQVVYTLTNNAAPVAQVAETQPVAAPMPDPTVATTEAIPVI